MNKCKRCGYDWQSRVDHPKACPSCKSFRWDREYQKPDVDLGELRQTLIRCNAPEYQKLKIAAADEGIALADLLGQLALRYLKVKQKED